MITLPISVDFTGGSPIKPPKKLFHYVDQGNYLTIPVEDESAFTLYSDSATSCIITIIIASKAGRQTVTLAHLDSPKCINALFSIVKNFDADTYQVIAQGANPPQNQTAKDNAQQLYASIDDLKPKVILSELSLLQGDPRESNRGDFGITIDANRAVASNQPYSLELFERDPTCGAQTVYCIMRRQEKPPTQIRNAALPFTHPELIELSSIALQFRTKPAEPSTAFTNIVNLESEEIRKNWSTTPEYEAPWFSDQLKLGAAFAIAMSPVVNLSEQHLLKTNPTSFSKLRKAIMSA